MSDAGKVRQRCSWIRIEGVGLDIFCLGSGATK